MKLFGQVAVHVRGEEILRRPGFLDKVKRAFGGNPDLRSGKMRASLEASALVDGVRDALKKLGVDNAVSLVIDDIVLFQDRDGRPDDLGDLFLAFHEQSDALGGSGFDLLRLSVEHEEAGLHIVIEVQGKTEHAATDPAVRVILSGRAKDLEPRKGEDAETYRARVEPIAKDTARFEVMRLQFESFVERVRDAIAASMPDTRVQVVTSEVRVQRPPKEGARRREPEEQDPRSRHYDPYMAYYPSPFDSMLSIMLWSSIFSMGMGHHPHYTIVNEHNEPHGHTDDPGAEHADPDAGSAGVDADGDGYVDGDAGGGADDGGGGWGDWGGDGGGDFGDFGGFD
jgi:hypothetical protein